MAGITQSKKAEPTVQKRDFKQEFLEMVANQSGPLAAATMEDAFKHQNKQLEEAMLGAGASMEGIAKNKGWGIWGNPESKTTVPQEDVNGAVTQQLAPPQPIQQPMPAQPPQKSAAYLALGKFLQGLGEVDKKVEDPSLARYRNASSALMEQQYEKSKTGEGADLVYRDPVTGEEVSPEQAQSDMEQGLGIYQVNQRISTRSGVVEKNLNKVPDLTEAEKKYVNDARVMLPVLDNLGTGFESIYKKYGTGTNWKALQIEKLPYFLAQDPEVQSLKSDLVYLKAAIPFLRGGKQLTATEAKRVDVMLNPFGKSKETYAKDLQRFENEFMYGSNIMQFGVNAGLMKRLIRGEKPTKSEKTVEKPAEDSGKDAKYQKFLELTGRSK